MMCFETCSYRHFKEEKDTHGKTQHTDDTQHHDCNGEEREADDKHGDDVLPDYTPPFRLRPSPVPSLPLVFILYMNMYCFFTIISRGSEMI